MIVSNPSSSIFIQSKEGTLLQPDLIDVGDLDTANVIAKTLVFKRSTDNKYCLPTVIQTKNSRITEKVLVNIGNWDMDADNNVVVTHNLGVNSIQIIGIDVFIFPDGGTTMRSIYQYTDNADPDLVGGGIEYYDETVIVLRRRTGGCFDGIGFDETPLNRGVILFTIDIS